MENEFITEMAANSVEAVENRPKRGRVPGSGRAPGTPNRATVIKRELLRAMTAATATPLEFLLAVMRSDSPLIDMKMRVEAARAALPYCHVRPGEAKPGDDARLVDDGLWTAEKAARLEFLQRERKGR